MWRLIIDEGNAYRNMAIDEALLTLKDRGLIPNTVRLYVFNPSAVTIGYFQRINDSVNLDYIKSNGIDLTRRISGGGSVFHDVNGEVTYSVIASINDVSQNVIESYKIICDGLIYAISQFGLKAEFIPINDVVVKNKKISGSAQSRRKTALLQHGTLMYNTDLNILSNSLKVPKEKLEQRKLTSIFERVTTLSRELGRTVSKDEVIEPLIKGFSKALNADFIRGWYTDKELELANELANKYRSREWIFQR
ncbi:MAG: biotin/lipoate A/B protein ligase family protein [Sulfolobales archaeon]|nr:lipoate--protein ligase family protein [Sulfolobales archaeon]MCX8186629.1 lipoate--protein ligase family protein [Sulfolobales archaeon]MDW7969924.1 biotin/lipoate A/B protein ligase family protein [Sulfolobales archaeon]